MKKQLTKAGTPRVRAPGAGRPPKSPSAKVVSRQVRVYLRTFNKLTEISRRSGHPLTEILAQAVDAMSVPESSVRPGEYPEGYEQ